MATYEEAKSALLTCQANRTFDSYGKVVSMEVYHDSSIDSNFLKVFFEKNSLKGSLADPVFVGSVKVLFEELGGSSARPATPITPANEVKPDNVPPHSG